MSAWELVLSALVALLGGGGLYKLVEALVRRAPAKAEAAELVNRMTVAWAKELQQDAEAAHKKVREVVAEADKLRTDMQADRARVQQLEAHVSRLSIEVERCTARLRHWRREIFSPRATLDSLRDMAGAANEHDENGTGDPS